MQFLKDVPGHLDWLHPSELDLYRTFRFEKRQKDWLLGRWTAKILLQESYFPDKDLTDLLVLPGENRAPFVYSHGEQEDCIISISHSHQQAFCVTADGSFLVGCDLEKVEVRSKAFLNDYFSENERKLHAGIAGVLSEEAFYTLAWSAKEALMKATRLGMSLHPLKMELSDILFSEQDDWNTINLMDHRTEREFCGYWRLKNEFIYTVIGECDFELSKE